MTSNLAASIHQKLLNRARKEGRPFNELLQYFALERFLHRLGCSPYADQFVLKGALMFMAWQSPFSRPTRDIDLLGFTNNNVAHVVTRIQEVCRQPVIEDGLHFIAETVAGERIIEAADYKGVRVHFAAYLGKARIPMQIDVGFGDPIVPGPSIIQLQTILDFPPPELRGYSRESVIAEKLESMVRLGEINSRMKDFFDIWLLATHFDFEGGVLAQAIHETFHHRRTMLPMLPVAFSDTFARHPEKQTQWEAFLHRHRLEKTEGIPSTLYQAVKVIFAFLQPIIQATLKRRCFDQYWCPGGPWTTSSYLKGTSQPPECSG